MLTVGKVKRNKELIDFYIKPGETLSSTARKFGLSVERTRQVIRKEAMNVCELHRKRFSGSCKFCLLDDLYNREIPMPELIEIINRLKGKDKSEFISYERTHLIKYLYNQFGHSIHYIGKLLDRDYRTIKHHLDV